MRAACEAILQGDFMTAMADLSPEAMAEAMNLAAGFSNVPMPQSYVIDSEDVVDDGHVFKLHFNAAQRELRATVGWALVDGAWKITTIQVDSVT